MKLPIILFLIFSGLACGQMNSELLMNDPDFVFPVYPNCKKHIKNNEKLESCFHENLWYDLNNLYKIDSFDYFEINADDQKTTVIFTVDKNGDLTNFGYTEESHPELAKDYLKQIRDTVLYNKKRKKYLIPAKYKGKPIDFKISMSVDLRYGGMN